MAKRERPRLADEQSAEDTPYFVSNDKSVEFVPTGCTALDCALGGGWALGRMANIVGDKSTAKTALATEALINFMIKFPEGRAAYRETEAAFDQDYAQAMGLKIDQVDLGDPDKPLLTVEDFARDFEKFLDDQTKARQPGIYVLDSLDALSDEAEMEADISKGTFGAAKAKRLSTLFRTLARKAERSRVLLLIVSQVRDNIGVCFDFNSKVVMADGSTKNIGTIVAQKLRGLVLRFNPENGEVETREIVDWHNNGQSDNFLKIEVDGPKTGKRYLLATPNHKIFTPDGEVEACKLTVGSQVLSLEEEFYSTGQHEIILGSLFGDGSLRFYTRNRASLRLGHGKAQYDYCKWKGEALGHGSFSYGPTGSIFYDTKTSADFIRYADFPAKKSTSKSGKARTSIPKKFISALTKRAVAIWYMDDGTFSGSSRCLGNGSCSISAKIGRAHV